jgi:hypothetical protein
MMKTLGNKKIKSGSVCPWVSLLAVAVLMGASVELAWAGKGNQGNHGVMPPQSNPPGQSYADWLSEWWVGYWPMSYEYYDQYPLGQSGHVGLLFNGTSDTIELAVAPGLKLCVSAYSCASGDFPEFWDQPFEDPVTGEEYDSEAEFSAEFVDRVNDAVPVRCWIDGREVRNLEAYRVEALFNGIYPENNWVGVPAGTQFVGLAEGRVVMLAPLAVGMHTVKLSYSVPDYFIPYFGFGGEFNLVFHITVRGGQK